MHEQELFKLAAKSDASADLEQVGTTRNTHDCTDVQVVHHGYEHISFVASASEGSETEAS